MAASMPKTIKEERLRWVLPICHKEVRLKDAAKVCPHGQRTLERWVAAYKKHGEAGLEAKSTRPKTNPKETPIREKERALELRRETKACALKLKWDLEEEGIFLHERTLGKFIKAEGLTRKYRVRKIQYKYIRVPLKAGDLMEIDVKYVPGKFNGQQYYQYTAIDVASRWRYLEVYDEQTKGTTIDFLCKVIVRFPYPIVAVKTDNHAVFTNRYTGAYRSDAPFPTLHAFDAACENRGIAHYLIDPGKPAQNGTVERSHREDQEKFYEQIAFATAEELRYKLRLWNMYYNDLKHCGLGGRSPNQALQIR